MTKTLITLLSASFIAVASSAQAITVTQWNFNSSSTAPSIGAGAASLVGGTTSPGFSSGAGSSDPSQPGLGWQTTTYPAQGAANKTAGVRFAVDTTGWSDITVTWDQRHSNTSSRIVQFQYSTNGTTFADFAPRFVAQNGGDTWYNGRSVSLSGIAGVDNNPNFAFRIVSAIELTSGNYMASNPAQNYLTTGTWRFDMVTVSAAPIPEPETYALMAAGLIALALAARRKAGHR